MPPVSPRRVYRTWVADSRRWEAYVARPDDIVIATYPKCGTTWMQQIVSLLVHGSPEPRELPHQAAWIERRYPMSVGDMAIALAAEPSPRQIKCHIPLDGIPYHADVRYIHVGRDGRDACMSYHNHCRAFTPAALANMDREGLADPWLGRPAPRAPESARAFFLSWLDEASIPGETDGLPFLSFFNFERTYWEARQRPNVLLVHYNDMKADLAGEMRRVADFLGIDIPPALWPALVAAAGFEAMKAAGDILLPHAGRIWEGGAGRFLHQGVNERWREVLEPADIARYDAKVAALLPPACARWLVQGRSALVA